MLIDLSQAVGSYLHEVFIAKFQWWVLLGYVAQIMFTIDLADELKASGVTVNALHPATYMDTTMVRAAGAEPRSTVAEGTAAVMQLAISPQLEGRTGEYFDGLRPARANDQAYDPQARRRLAEVSARLAGIDPA